MANEHASTSMPPRPRNTAAAFLIGLPISAGILVWLNYGPFEGTVAQRYIHHPVECVEVVMFCCALGALAAKLLGAWIDRRAWQRELLPPWNGESVPVGQAQPLLARLAGSPRSARKTLLVRRVVNILDFLCSRGSAVELDDQMRALADNDALVMENSYALVRFITWAVPILGFLGTVLGITGAISGVTPERLESSLSTVTDGLALAFDTTALALALTMITMFCSFVVERAEQGVLDRVDRYVEQELAHRFQRPEKGTEEFVGIVRSHSQIVLDSIEQLTGRQAALFAQALQETDRRRQKAETDMHQRLTSALDAAIGSSLEAHGKRLESLENQALERTVELAKLLAGLAKAVEATGMGVQASLAQLGERMAAQTDVLAHLQEGDRQVRRLQETLSQNLATLAGVGTFEQAIHSLTAAIHLFTARSAPGVPQGSTRLGPGSKAAA